MLATLGLWLTAALAVLGLADLFLSKAQKDWLDNAVVKLWTILDEAKGLSFADWLKHPQAKWWLAISLGLFVAIGLVTLLWDTVEPVFAAPIVIAIVVTITWLAHPVLGWLLEFTPTVRFGHKLTIVSVLATVGLVSTVTVAWFEYTSSLHGTFFGVVIEPFIKRLVWASAISLLCVPMILAARALAYIASAILYVGEFVVRRIAEYPKGPILALSALFGGICALIKAFG
jgi:hypothetical protein